MILALLAAILFALWRSWDNSEQRLFWYFYAQLIYTLLGYGAYKLFGDTSWQYLTVYLLGTSIILVTMARIVWEAVKRKSKLLGIPGVLSFGLGALAASGLHPMSLYEWAGVLEGSLLMGCAVVIGYSAYYHARHDIRLILASLWTVLGLFRLGFYLNLPSEAWLKMNWQIPGWSCVMAFTLIGFRLGLKGLDASSAVLESRQSLR